MTGCAGASSTNTSKSSSSAPGTTEPAQGALPQAYVSSTTELVAGFPQQLPVFPGAKVVFSEFDPQPSGTALPAGAVMFHANLYIPTTQRSDVIAFYQDALNKVGPQSDFRAAGESWMGFGGTIPVPSYHVSISPAKLDHWAGHDLIELKVFLLGHERKT